MRGAEARQHTVVLGVLRDLHHFGVKILEHACQQEGFKPVLVGKMLDQEDFIRAAIETGASVVLVSSSYGHAEIDCQGFREKCQEAGLGTILLYAGGNLTVTRQAQPWAEVEARFRAMGFDRVYPPNTSPAQVMQDLKADLSAREDG